MTIAQHDQFYVDGGTVERLPAIPSGQFVYVPLDGYRATLDGNSCVGTTREAAVKNVLDVIEARRRKFYLKLLSSIDA